MLYGICEGWLSPFVYLLEIFACLDDKFLVPSKSHDNHWREGTRNNGLKCYMKRDLFAYQYIDLVLLFFFQLQLL